MTRLSRCAHSSAGAGQPALHVEVGAKRCTCPENLTIRYPDCSCRLAEHPRDPEHPLLEDCHGVVALDRRGGDDPAEQLGVQVRLRDARRDRIPLTICGSNVPARSRGTSTCTWPVLSVSTVLGREPLRTFPLSLPARVITWIR